MHVPPFASPAGAGTSAIQAKKIRTLQKSRNLPIAAFFVT
jgi:hypothetical protein